jgi:hypothetical protein
MRLVVMNAEERFAQSKCDGLRGLESNEQRGRQSGSLRGGNGIEFVGANFCALQSSPGNGQ